MVLFVSLCPSNGDLSYYFRAYELQEPSATPYNISTKPGLISRLDALTKNVVAELKRQGFKGTRVRTERMLNMRFEGTDTALMVLCEGDEIDGEDFGAAFKREYKKEFGFLLETKMVVDDVKVRVQCSSSCVVFKGI